MQNLIHILSRSVRDLIRCMISPKRNEIINTQQNQFCLVVICCLVFLVEVLLDGLLLGLSLVAGLLN